MPSFKDITGTRSGKLRVVSFHSMVPHGPRRTALWTCQCDCGTTLQKKGYLITAGMVASCGCIGTGHVKHGHARKGLTSPEYNSWAGIKNRCTHPSHKDYPHYGGRGIDMCNRWRESFEAFLQDMGRRPGPGYTIDRIDNDGHYEPGNCRWADHAEQVSNRSISVKIDGKTLRQIAADSGLSYSLVHGRYYSGARTVADLTAPPNPNHLWRNNGRTVVDRRTGEVIGEKP